MVFYVYLGLRLCYCLFWMWAISLSKVMDYLFDFTVRLLCSCLWYIPGVRVTSYLLSLWLIVVYSLVLSWVHVWIVRFFMCILCVHHIFLLVIIVDNVLLWVYEVFLAYGRCFVLFFIHVPYVFIATVTCLQTCQLFLPVVAACHVQWIYIYLLPINSHYSFSNEHIFLCKGDSVINCSIEWNPLPTVLSPS